jgi:amicoumacin kinase
MIEAGRLIAEEAVRHWFPEAAALTYIHDSENSVYSFVGGVPPQRFLLRLTHPAHRSDEQIKAELDFVLYLDHEGCRVSRPVFSRHERLIETLSSGLFACVFEAAPGSCVEVGSNAWGPQLFQTWGSFLGQMHCAAKSYVPEGPRRRRWDEDESLVNADQYLPANETSARREWERVLEGLAQLRSDSDDYGLIHGDLCRVNFHYDGRNIIAFDFDDCCYHWFIYDLVCALAAATFRPSEERRAYRNWLIEGYQQMNMLHEGWEEEFDWLLRLRSVYIFTHYLRKANGNIEHHPKRRLLELLRNSFGQPVVW